MTLTPQRLCKLVVTLSLAAYLALAVLPTLVGLVSRFLALTVDSDSLFQAAQAPPFPNIKSTHSLVAKHVTPEKWAKLGGIKTKTSGFTLGQVSYLFNILSQCFSSLGI